MSVTDLDRLSDSSATIRDVSDEHPRLCGICGTEPIGPDRIACSACTRQADWIARNDPYWWMQDGATKPQPPDGV